MTLGLLGVVPGIMRKDEGKGEGKHGNIFPNSPIYENSSD